MMPGEGNCVCSASPTAQTGKIRGNPVTYQIAPDFMLFGKPSSLCRRRLSYGRSYAPERRKPYPHQCRSRREKKAEHIWPTRIP